MKIQLGRITEDINIQINLDEISNIDLLDFIVGDLHSRSKLANEMFIMILDYVSI